jgi:hypothetical protein
MVALTGIERVTSQSSSVQLGLTQSFTSSSYGAHAENSATDPWRRHSVVTCGDTPHYIPLGSTKPVGGGVIERTKTLDQALKLDFDTAFPGTAL